MNLKISWLKSSSDNTSFKMFKNLGLDVFDVEDLDKTDEKLEELIKNNYETIVISNELASFSENIVRKYRKSNNINIFISPSKYK